ncbi:MAG: Mur ligase family protein [Acidobacteriota bacterium]
MPETSLDIYMIAMGGTGMAPLACLLQDLGHRVRGVDGPLYPPMSTLLEEAGLEPAVGYDPAHLEAGPRPDLVVVGNAVPRHNPEAQAAERLGLERMSMPEALAHFLLSGRRPLVCAGTHGKTTTSSMAAWVPSDCGRNPGFLIGGVPRDLGVGFRVGGGDRFVIEGDEYNAAYFDRGPKFLHYRPHTLILTSVEHDHVDLYPDHEALKSAFRDLLRLVPEEGLAVACGDSPELRELVSEAARCPVLFYGLDPSNDLYARRDAGGEVRVFEGSLFQEAGDAGGRGEALALPVPGDHNLQNALAVWAAARADGLGAAEVAAALGRFRGAKRRLEELGEPNGVLVVDDFAHHPTAVAASLGGLRQRYPERRLIALFEPRSLTAGREFFFEPYLEAFQRADAVLFAPIHYRERLSAEETLDLPALTASLEDAGTSARALGSIGELYDLALAEARPGDVWVTMSSGSFEGLPGRLAAGLLTPRAGR